MKRDEEKTKLVDAASLAALLGVSHRTVLYWAERGEIPIAIRKRRVIRFDPDEVAEALRDAAGTLNPEGKIGGRNA